MLSTNRSIKTDVSVNVTGQSEVDGEIVARYAAHVDPDEERLTITTVIYDRDKYKSDCAGDESEFEDAVYESEKQIMDKREEISGLFKDDDKTGAGNEETIIP